MEPAMGVEPMALCLQGRSSTAELRRLVQMRQRRVPGFNELHKPPWQWKRRQGLDGSFVLRNVSA